MNSCFNFDLYQQRMDEVTARITSDPESIKIEEVMDLFMDTGAAIGHMKSTAKLAGVMTMPETDEINKKVQVLMTLQSIMYPTILSMAGVSDRVQTEKILDELLTMMSNKTNAHKN